MKMRFIDALRRRVKFWGVLALLLFLSNLLCLRVLAQTPVPDVTINLPAETFIGEGISFTVAFDNASPADTGYGPFIDLIFPVNGADGAAGTSTPDGFRFVSATYLGAPVTAIELVFPDADGAGPGTTGCVNHSLAVDSSGAPLQVCGTAGDRLVVLQLPFGSFTPDQPPAVITINATLSNLADLNVPLAFYARAGFQYGADPLDNPATDPSIVSDASTDVTTWAENAASTPTVMRLTKTYIGPEDETATGPNFPRQYRITVDIADGQTITNLDLTDILANNIQFVQVDSTTIRGTPTATTAIATPSTSVPGGTLTRRFASVTGTTASNDAEMVFTFYVPLNDAIGQPVINAATGDDALSIDDALASGTWVPLDLRDLPAMTVTSNVTTNDHTLTDKSIAIQKSVAIVVDTGLTGASPGDVLEYTLDFQISDYFAFQNITIPADVLGDGVRFLQTFTPTLRVTENGVTLGPVPFAPQHYTVTPNYTPDSPPPNDGTTTITFNISGQLITSGRSGQMLGGLVADGGPTNDGPTTGQIKFRAVIQEAYSDSYPSGDPYLNENDSVHNAVTIRGDLLNVATCGTGTCTATTGFLEEDTSGATVTIAKGPLSKEIYAVNGVVGAPANQIAPGDDVTYRIQATLLIGDYEQLKFTDYLPLPIFKVGDPDADGAPGPVWAFDGSAAVTPPAGQWKRGPNDTAYGRSGVVPTVTIDVTSNYLRFDYGTYDDTLNTPMTVDILFTVRVSADPFADGLYLTNQVRKSQQNTQEEPCVRDEIIQVQLTEPVLTISKGAVATDAPTGTFSPSTVGPVTFTAPGSACPRFSGTISSNGLASAPINSNLSGLDAGDKATFAIVIENKGMGLHGAFDIRVRDSLPTGLTFVPGSLCVVDGTGAPISYVTLGAGLFDPSGGIELVDPGPTATPEGALDPYHATSGRNVAIILYDVQLTTAVQPLQSLVNTATLYHYAGIEGGPDHTLTDLTDNATVTALAPRAGKRLVGTEINLAPNDNAEAVIGELVTYTLYITVPEGTTPNATIVDTLDAGLAFVDFVPGFSNSNPSEVTLTGSTTPVITNNGRTLTWNLGTITNANTNNAVAEVLTFGYRAVVLNVSGNQAGTLLNNSAVLSWTGGTLAAVSAPNVMVIEPALDAAKSVNRTTADAGDWITYTITLKHTASSGADAFDVTFSDPLPKTGSGASLIVSPSFSVADSAGLVTAASFELVGSNAAGWTLQTKPGVSFDMPWSTSRTITLTVWGTVSYLAAPSQSIQNTATVRWTSLDGDPGQRSTYNTSSTERTGADGPGGALNDYADTGAATFTVFAPSPTKTIVATSEAHTTNVGGTERVAIGEIVRYRLVMRISEGTATNLQFRDQLPTGLRFLDDGTAKAAFVSNGPVGITSTLLAGAGLQQTGNESNIGSITPTFVLPDEAVSASPTTDDDNYASGTDPYFKFGTVVNNDSDSDQEFVVVEFNAVVENIAGNQAFNNATGAASATSRANNFQVLVGGSSIATSGNVNVNIAEPVIRNLTKTIVSPAPTDAGDTVRYRLEYSNTASGNDRATAFDVLITDTVSTLLDLQSVAVAVPAGSTATDNSTLGVGGVVRVAVDKLPPTVDIPGAQKSVVITVTARVVATAPAGQTIPNAANLTYTSLPGPNGTTTNPTGSSTPGASGSATGERNGSSGAGGLNDYVSSANISTTLATPTIEKFTPSPTFYAVGQQVIYPLRVTLPEGVTQGLIVFDDLPAGMAYVGYQVIPSAAASGGLLTADFAGTVPTPTVTAPGGSGGDVTLTFGNTTTIDDNDSTNNRFLVRIIAVVLNVAANQDGTTLTNSAQLRYTNPNTGSTVTVNAPQTPTITVIEPVLELRKTIITPPNPADAGGTLTYRILINHTANSRSAAYDVVFTDTIPSGITAFNNIYVTATGITPPSFEIVGNQLRVPSTADGSFDLPLGATVTIQFDATIDQSAQPAQVITNTGNVAWTSTDGPNPDERTGNTSDPGGALNDYRTSNSVSFAVDDLQAVKSLVGTSAGHTMGSQVTIGEVITYAVAITLPEGTLPGLTVVDILPAGLAYVAGSASVDTSAFNGVIPAPTIVAPGGNGDDVTLTFGQIVVTADNVPTNNRVVIRLRVRVLDVPSNVGLPPQTVLPNSATVQMTGGTLHNAGTVNVTVVEPRMSIRKVIEPPQAAAGDVVTFTLTVSNTGTATAFDVIVEDVLLNSEFVNPSAVSTPAGFSFGLVFNGNITAVRYTGGEIGVGQTVTFVFRAALASGVVPGSVLNNTAVVSQATTLPGADSYERDEPDVQASDAVTVIVPDLVVSKTDGQTIVVPGQVLTYVVTIANQGGRAATGVVITDAIPAHTTYVEGSASHGGVYASGRVVWNVATLGAGESITRTFQVVVNDPLPAGVTHITNTVTARDDGTHGADPTPEDNEDVDVDGVEASPDLVVAKDDGEAVVVPGQVLTYTVVVRNVGDQGATGVVVTDVLPAEVAYVAGSAVPEAAEVDGRLVWVLGDLGAGEVVTVTFRAEVMEAVAAGVEWITNVVEVRDDGLNGADPTPEDNEDVDVDGVEASPVISAAKRAALWNDVDASGNVSPGDVLQYTAVLRNTGNREAVDLAYTDTPDMHTTLVNGSVTTTQGTITSGNASGDGTIEVLIGSLWPGEVVTITYQVTINIPFPEEISSVENQGLVSGGNVPSTPTDDPTTPDDRDPTLVPVTITPRLVATKVAALYQDVDASGSTTPGDILEYTVHITNVGTATAYGVVFQDLLDPNTTLVAGSVYTSQGVVTVGNGPHDEYVIIEVGHLAPYGGAVEIRYRVRINSPLPAGVTLISNQGFIDGSNIPSTVTDDPTTPEPDDPTDVVVSPPTYVGLLYVDAAYLNGRQVLVRWETAIEVDNVLFRLYRAPTANWSDASLIAEVPSQAQAGQGAFYAYVDDVPDSGAWWYWLEDVNTMGGTVRHGPVEAFQGAFRYYVPILAR